MSGNTAVEGYPYPFTTDFADVQDVYRLAMSVDADLRGEQAPFRAFEGRLGFIAQQTVNGSGFLSGSDSLKIGAIQFDNTGGLVLGATQWVQPTVQQPSWWMLGATVLSTAITGTPVVGDLVMGMIRVSTTDQVTGLSTLTRAYQRSDETNTNGEWLNVFTVQALYRATASAEIELNGSTQKAISAGSTFWGLYLGPVT
jgi:hypothetical protein